MGFLQSFFDITESESETAVCCPFEHYTSSGLAYYEQNPSAHVNGLEGLFHCKVCGTGYSETQFIQELCGCSYLSAKGIQRCFNNLEDLTEWEASTKLSEATKTRCLNLGISETIINTLKIKTPVATNDVIAFPVFMYNHLLDIRSYNPGAKPKIKSRSGAMAGLIFPFDIWKVSPLDRITILCAGEKDMAIARTYGFNAITLTGGENALCLTPKFFKGRKIVICYDNDAAGKEGAVKLATQLYEYTQDIKVCTNFHTICKESGEDITDFFTKYNKTREDLINFIERTENFSPSEAHTTVAHPLVSLFEAAKPQNINKLIQSNIQVVAMSESSFVVPSSVVAEKFKFADDNDTMAVGDIREWELTNENVESILHLMDNNFKEDDINANLKKFLKIPLKERCIKLKHLTKRTVFKAFITDMTETSDTTVQPLEFMAYSIDHKLESGKKYLVTYKLVPHPYKGSQLTMIITNIKQADDSVSNFKLTDEVKSRLQTIKDLTGSTADKLILMAEKVKGLLGYDGNNLLIKTIDLAFHTALTFNFGTFQHVRGTLDTLVVGESRVGKSSTADTLRKLYELGVFTSLAGNSATIPGLVGGSNKTSNGSYQTRAGIIPQNHRGLIIFEEFGKCNANITKELTDIRSSGEVRIARVSGMITMPALVRMVTLSNVKNTTGTIKPIASYPNGIAVIIELIGTAEDIARYDVMAVLSDKGASQINPFWVPQEPFPKEIYQTRIRWIWSRTPEQIIIDREVGLYILEQSNLLNQLYDSHIKIFGTEAWKKIARLSIAIAGYLVSTDDSFENIIVTKEHVDCAITMFNELYNNDTFKLKEYVEHEKRYSIVDEEGIALLQDIYDKYASLVIQLEQSTTASKQMLSAATGLENDNLNRALQALTKGLFIRFNNHDIVPTERFRGTLRRIHRGAHPLRVGEHHA